VIRRSPAERYLKYLLCLPSTQSIQAVLELCELKQVDSVGEDYLRRLSLSLELPMSFAPQDPRHWESQATLMRLGIYELFQQNSDTKAMWEILESARAKEFVESMALLGAPTGVMADQVAAKYEIQCTEESLRLYLKFFWDLTLVDSTETRALLSLRWKTTSMKPVVTGRAPDGSPITREHDAATHLEALGKAMHGDPRHIASSLPSSPYTALVAQMRMGMLPNKLDTRKTLETAEKMLALRLLESASGTGPFDAERSGQWTSSIKNLREVISNMSPPEEALARQINAFAIEVSSDPVPGIHSLTGGDHTTQLLPDSLLQGHGEDDGEVP